MKKINIILCLGAITTIWSCSGKDKVVANEEMDERPIIEVDVAREKPVEISRSYTANVEADNINNISPAMSNRIESIKVDVGDRVAKGQVVAVLDSSSAEQQRINMELTELQYKRALELLEIGSGTQSAVDQLKAQLDAQCTQYQNTLTNTVLKSPISGVVTQRNYDPGDMSGQLPILVVGQTSPNVKLMINVNESDVAVVKNGMEVGISFDAYPGEEFNGRIVRISPAVDVNSRTFPVEVSVANRGDRIKPGMFARVDIKLGTRNNVVLPDRAVVKQSGSSKKFVFTYKDGRVSYVPVELGQRIDDSYELLSGVTAGDTVVITGQSRLIDGAEAVVKEN